MEYSLVQLNDLADELLLAILSKLSNIEAVYSLVGVNQRLDRIVRDVVYTRHVDLMVEPAASTLDRFCLHILPRIHHNVECLTLEATSIERVLLAGSYPKLRKLTLAKLDQLVASRYFTADSSLAHIFKEQILQLVVTLTDVPERSSLVELSTKVYIGVLAIFSNLTILDFDRWNRSQYPAVSLCDLPPSAGFSSTLVDLRIGVSTFDDCLRLLDGRLNQLQRFIVKVDLMPDQSSIIVNTQSLPNLKCFSLKMYRRIYGYDSHIVPLLHRMSNLEELALFLTIRSRSTFIDGTELEKEIVIHMPRLRTFIFNICTHRVPINGIPLRSNDDIRRTFVDSRVFRYVDCYVDYLPNDIGRCHVYSLPFTMDCLRGITNNFPGGHFNCVRELSIVDILVPFEHDFFVRIARDFPLLVKLSVFNFTAPEQKRPRHFIDDHQATSIVVYPNLTDLDIRWTVVGYSEQFLLDTNTSLPSLRTLGINREDLLIVTDNFTSDAARSNCARIERLIFLQEEAFVHAKDFYVCFPLL